MKVRGVIDRFEGDYAVMEIAGRMQNILRRELPADSREGDVLICENDRWCRQIQTTKELKKNIGKMAEKLWED